MSEDFFSSLSLEEEVGVSFHIEDVESPNINEEVITKWIKAVINHHDAQLGELQYIFCSDRYLHRLNVEYLDHDTLTDIITFPYADAPQVHGDLYISTERVADNAADRSLPVKIELCRVIIHGVLHLCGYGDKTPVEAEAMRKMEEEALAMLPANA